MASQAHLSVVAPAPTPKPRNTNKGRKFPPDPIRVEEFAKLLDACVPLTPGRYGELAAIRLHTLVVLLYRTGLRISEALDLYEHDLRHEGRNLADDLTDSAHLSLCVTSLASINHVDSHSGFAHRVIGQS